MATERATDAWQGLRVVDDHLWYVQATPTRGRPRVCFGPDALVVVDEAGRETWLRWDDHVAADRSQPGGRQWLLHGLAPSRTDLAGVWLVAGRFRWTGQTGRWARGGPYHAAVLDILDACDGPAPGRGATNANADGSGAPDGHGETPEVTVDLVAGRGRGQAPWEEVPALAAYLAATPAARSGLADPDRTGALVGDLRTRSWRRPRPPIEPLLGDRLDLHVAVRAVLQQRVPRRFGGRLVRGEPTLSAGELVPEVMDHLSPRVRHRIAPERVVRLVERHLAVGRWPFDALLPPPGS